MPFIEFNLLSNRRFVANVGLGTSYFTKKYSPISNPENKAITTHYTWAFRLFFHYEIIDADILNLDIGVGYFHQSNGHIRLKNEGLNSIFASTSVSFDFNANPTVTQEQFTETIPEKSSSTYLDFRLGIGVNVLSELLNDRREVYTAALMMGKTYNKTFKLGLGLFYRFYENYYEYIKSPGELVEKNYAEFMQQPYRYSTNYNVNLNVEVVLNHIGLTWQIGYNLYKPFYEVERQVGQAYTYHVHTPNGPVKIYEYGDLDFNYKLKKAISTRLGLRLYLLSTEMNPALNVYLDAAINANFGQADFGEFSLGLVHQFDFTSQT